MKRHLLVLLAFSGILLVNACKQDAAVDDAQSQLPDRLTVAPGLDTTVGGYILVQGVMPKEGNQDARQFAAVLFCNGSWTWPNEQQTQQYNNFRTWLMTTPAESNNKGLSYQDISVTCQADSTIQFKSNSFDRTLALLAAGVQGEHTITRGTGDAAGDIQFPANGNPLTVHITSTAVEGGDASGTAGTVTATQAGKNVDIISNGRSASFTYDPGQPLTLTATRSSGDLQTFQDVVTLGYNDGALSWKQTRK